MSVFDCTVRLDQRVRQPATVASIERGACRSTGCGDLGVAYLGTQGHVWDAQRDMALASLGALIAMVVTALINVRLQRDFAREWQESLRVKRALPPGEDEIGRMLRGRKLEG